MVKLRLTKDEINIIISMMIGEDHKTVRFLEEQEDLTPVVRDTVEEGLAKRRKIVGYLEAEIERVTKND